jgi:hypothetical protein
LEATIADLRNQNADLRSRLGALNDIDRVKLEYESRISTQNSEIDRFQKALAAKNDENG